ncbi:MAG: hypothetical protein BMS9Abin05_0256 [Rhodothermia bacterium]|nr:MAG: hypothetical protein BMS9Abin05_0256 [Rhodothermia bacterium]
MSDAFTSDLASKLSLDEAEVDRQIERFVDTLIDEIKQGGRAQISDFGEFQFDEDDLIFTPDTVLLEAINYRYRSLSTFSIPVPASTEVVPSSTAENLEAASKRPSDEEIADALIPEESSPETSVAASVSAQKPDRRSSETRSSGKQGFSKRPIFWLVPILLVAAALVIIFKPGDSTTETISQVDPSIESSVGEAESVDPAEEEDVSNLETDSGSNPDVAATEQGFDGLTQTELAPTELLPTGQTQLSTGRAASNPFVSDFTRSAPGYTLVVGSVFSLEDAESEIRRFSNLLLPLAILDYEDNGVTRYRLAVGRFETIEAAQQRMQAAAEQFPNGTWVRRIR